MKSIIFHIAILLLGAFVLYWIVKSVIESAKLGRIRKKNLDAQFSGSAVKEEKGVLSSVFTTRHNSRAEAIGDIGERNVSTYLSDLPYEEYDVFNDLLIRDGKYTSQVDHIIICRSGVFVLETKNIHGKVYGSSNTEFWKQYLPDTGYRQYGFTKEHQLRNPIWQNEGHIKTLRRLVFGNDVPIYGIVVFPNATELYITTDQPVLKMCDIVSYIKRHGDDVLSTDQVRFYRRRLLEVISTTEEDRIGHVDNVNHIRERRDTAVANGRCPRCGGYLVLRHGKYGLFYGCSNYPQCKYTHPS